MLNSSATQTAAFGEAKQSRRKQELLSKSLKASYTDSSDLALCFPDRKFIFPQRLKPRRGTVGRSPANQAAVGSRPEARHYRADFCLAVIHFQMQREKGRLIVPCEASVGKPVPAAV